ncbi:hypothetical protein AMJ47_02155 [Parcubacteria bacterium DG_72]|nr:MAG: hypothetical protein AMJ47_02155 [Parcubacteria bacterium DG_72]
MVKRIAGELYQRASINDLILFCLLTKKPSCDFEDLVNECFRNFPKVFCFSKIKKWPDSRKLDRPLRTLRKKKLIKGSPEKGFSLTSTGKQRAEEVVKSFRQEKLKI